jgi:hypothetical protein
MTSKDTVGYIMRKNRTKCQVHMLVVVQQWRSWLSLKVDTPKWILLSVFPSPRTTCQHFLLRCFYCLSFLLLYFCRSKDAFLSGLIFSFEVPLKVSMFPRHRGSMRSGIRDRRSERTRQGVRYGIFVASALAQPEEGYGVLPIYSLI